MTAAYTVAPITPAQVDQAFLLIHLAEPTMTIEDWRRVCGPNPRSFHDGGAPWQVGAVLVAAGPRGYVRGLSVVGAGRVRDDGRTIEVPAFVAPSAVDPDGVSVALLRAVIGLCRDNRCTKLSVVVPAGDGTAYQALGRASAALGVELDRLALELRPSAGGTAA